MTPQATVEAFIEAFSCGDEAAAEAFLDENLIWHNIPMEPVVGLAASRALMAALPKFDGMGSVVRNIAADGNSVLVERVDKFLINGTWHEIRVMGAFDINAEGKISYWRDYFDMAEFTRPFM